MRNQGGVTVAMCGFRDLSLRAGDLRQTSWTGRLMVWCCTLLLAALLAGCGGGGSDSGATTYSVGGTISGLDGTLVLQNNGGDNLSRSTNGAFNFGTRLPAGSAHAVTVLSQPAGQICQVTNGSGTVGTANVTSIQVACADVAAGGNNASLSALTLSSGTLDPAFAANQLAYTSTQAFPVSSLQVTPTAQAAGATLTVNGTAVTSGQASPAITLADGAPTLISVVVTAANGTTTQTYTITVSRQPASAFAQQAYIKASNPDGVGSNPGGAGDQFGYSIALSGDGNTLAVGAPYESSNATGINGAQGNNLSSESGAVYVFVRSAGVWVQQAYVKASNNGMSDKFGHSVTLSGDGNVMAVGAFAEDSGVVGNQNDNSVTNAGAAYVFTRTGAAWSQQAYLKASNVQAQDSVTTFGWSVSLSSDGATLAVGAPNEDSNATGVNGNQDNELAEASGAAYVFTQSGGTWTQQAYIKASNTQNNDQFGGVVRLSGDGNTLAVGAAGEDSNATSIDGDQTSNAASGSGAVYVYVRSGATWSQQAYIKATNTRTNDNFGTALAISADGNTLAVGAESEGSGATGINGDQMSSAAAGSGAVYVFTRVVATWSHQAYIKASNTAAQDAFGGSVAISGDGNTLVVGAAEEDSDATGVNGSQANNLASGSGAVYVFGRSGGTWTQRAYVKSSNSETFDQFAKSIALSADGDTLAVGADAEDSNATGVNGNQSNNAFPSSGAAYVFTGVSAP